MKSHQYLGTNSTTKQGGTNSDVTNNQPIHADGTPPPPSESTIQRHANISGTNQPLASLVGGS